jgi:hypothetical protein
MIPLGDILSFEIARKVMIGIGWERSYGLFVRIGMLDSDR